MAQGQSKSRRPRRTRQHVIASLGRNYVEGVILEKGHTADRKIEDYGYDLLMETYDEEGYIENGEIRVQIKATDRLDRLTYGESIRIEIDMRHYELWTNEPMPVFLIVYDARSRTAYWLDVRGYFSLNTSRKPKKNTRTLRVEIPLANEFTTDTVEYMRSRKADTLAQERARRKSDG